MSGGGHRGTIFVEDAEVLGHAAWPDQQFILTVRAPKVAARARPGTFAHLTCDPDLPMRRPLSIMRADPESGTLEFLYKIVGHGLAQLASKRPGDTLSVMGPIGQPFEPHRERPRTLLIGGGVGIPPMIFFAEALADDAGARWQPLVLMGSEIPFPFATRPSTILVDGMPEGAIACLPELDGIGVPSRLASGAGFPGCYEGFVTELAREWLQRLDAGTLAQVEVFACGPTPMLKAAAALARAFDLPCQVSLEEYMACAVGGCAGCTVLVHTDDGPAMKRVCVDGPVFDARQVFPDAA
jgi:dihydroorotate dehydrogenase electron transfer subunit